MSQVVETKQKIDQVYQQLNALNQELANNTMVDGNGFEVHASFDVETKQIEAVINAEGVATVFTVDQIRELHGKIAEFLQKVAE